MVGLLHDCAIVNVFALPLTVDVCTTITRGFLLCCSGSTPVQDGLFLVQGVCTTLTYMYIIVYKFAYTVKLSGSLISTCEYISVDRFPQVKIQKLFLRT